MTFRLLCAGSKPVLPKGGLEIFQMGTLPRWALISSKWFCNSVELVDNPRWGYIYNLISENKVKYYEAITWYRIRAMVASKAPFGIGKEKLRTLRVVAFLGSGSYGGLRPGGVVLRAATKIEKPLGYTSQHNRSEFLCGATQTDSQICTNLHVRRLSSYLRWWFGMQTICIKRML